VKAGRDSPRLAVIKGYGAPFGAIPVCSEGEVAVVKLKGR
jgi:hypothetical protein